MNPFWSLQRVVVDRVRGFVNRWQSTSQGASGAPRYVERLAAVRDALPLVQPDRTSCGSSCLTVLRALRDPALVATSLAPGAFDRAALGVRRRTNALIDASGRVQLPWPAALGVRPAAMVRLLESGTGFGAPGVRYRNRVLDPGRLDAGYAEIAAVVRADEPVLLYVGDGHWMQHIVLVVTADENTLGVYDPAVGRIVAIPRPDFAADRIAVAGWSRPWLAILPR